MDNNILLVDNDKIFIEILKNSLNAIAKVDVCMNKFEALYLIILCDYDLVILDLDLYDSGINLIKMINDNKYVKTKMITITSMFSDDYKFKNVIAKFKKPIDSNRLRIEIEKFFKENKKGDRSPL